MVDNIIKFLQDIMTAELVVLTVAAVPLTGLRGSLPLAILFYNMPFIKAFTLSVVGNMLPVIPLLFFLRYLTKELNRVPLFKKFFNWWFTKTRARSALVEKYEIIGLCIFVAIPLPLTGAWSGCVAAYLFNLKFRYAVPAIFLGIFLAGVIVSLALQMGIWFIR